MSEKTEAPAGGSRQEESSTDFVRAIVAADVESGKNGGKVVTRFPPEPNGYLHIGHAKSICLNFGIAAEFGGTCNLRFDDTNPTKEDVEYVDSIKEDVRWLGFDWQDREYYASDYFDTLHRYAVRLIEQGDAYVDSQSAEEIRLTRGTFTEKGKESPYRNRSVAENLELFERMRSGELEEGSHVLRAKIDMASPNINLRDPTMYRIRKAAHHRTGDEWCIYPMYDWAHGQSDSIEGVTHSICTLEFEDHRPLYDWCLERLGIHHPQQIEFARLNLTYTVMSKRRLLQLVSEKHVDGWDDPRMPTICGLRRRGYTPEAIRSFCDRIGVAKRDNMVDVAMLEHAVREHLNETSPRVMAVLKPVKLVIDNFPEGEVVEFDCPYFPDEPEKGSRKVPFSKVLYVERDDYRDEAPRKWHRLAPGKEVRLRYACLVTCTSVVKDDAGEVTEIHCTWDPESKGGNAPDGRKVRGTLHWVSAEHGIEAEVRLYDRLFAKENPMDLAEGEDFKDSINPASLEILEGCRLEPAMAGAEPGSRWQFERLGYFCVDTRAGDARRPVFNRTVPLRDTWARVERSQQRKQR